MQRNTGGSSVPTLSEFHFRKRRWGYVGSSHIRSTLLRRVDESGALVLYADQGDSESPSVLYVPTETGWFDLYRKQRADPQSSYGPA